MDEIGFNISNIYPKTVWDRAAEEEAFDYVITLCDGTSVDNCPVFTSNIKMLYSDVAAVLSWSIADFSELEGSEQENLLFARAIRDQIKSNIKEFIRQHYADIVTTEF